MLNGSKRYGHHIDLYYFKDGKVGPLLSVVYILDNFSSNKRGHHFNILLSGEGG